MNGWIILVTYIVLNATYVLETMAVKVPADWGFISSVVTYLLTSRGLATLVCGLFLLFSFKAVWTKIWSFSWIGGLLSKTIYPDLNGEWEFTIKTNWPILNELQSTTEIGNANKLKNSSREQPTKLQEKKFRADIDQSWLSTKVKFKKHNHSELNNSRTISAELLKGNDGDEKRIAWIFEQENKLPSADTDVQGFLGSALLTLGSDYKTMEGLYWTNRNWERGLNTAGLIYARKI